MKFEWELIDEEGTCRAKVFGGWIVRDHDYKGSLDDSADSTALAMVFIPDPNHEWQLENIRS